MAAKTKIDFKWLTDNKMAVAIIAGIVLLVAFYFLFWKNRNKGGGLLNTGSDTNDSPEDSKGILQLLLDQGIKPTLSDADYSSMADSIYANLKTSAISDNKGAAKRTLLLVKNDYDFHALNAKFGNRMEFYFGLPTGGKKPLSAFVTSNFSKKTIGEINKDYAAKGMTYRF